MRVEEIYKIAKKTNGVLYCEIPFRKPMSVKLTPDGSEQIGDGIETIVVLNPDRKEDLMQVIKYLQDGDTLFKHKCEMDAIRQAKIKAVEVAEVKAEDLFEETDVIVNGEILYRRK